VRFRRLAGDFHAREDAHAEKKIVARSRCGKKEAAAIADQDLLRAFVYLSLAREGRYGKIEDSRWFPRRPGRPRSDSIINCEIKAGRCVLRSLRRYLRLSPGATAAILRELRVTHAISEKGCPRGIETFRLSTYSKLHLLE